MSKTELFVRKQIGGIYTLAAEKSTTGNIFWVDSGATSGGADATNYGKSPASPFLTIDYAIGKCTDNNGDIIYVMPGHAESLASATSLAIDKAGVKIIGLGHGFSIPKLTFTSLIGATIAITAANCHLENLWLYQAFSTGVAAGITASADAGGLVLKNIVMEESAAHYEFLIGIQIAALAHHVTIDGLKFYGIVGGHSSQCIKFVGASNFSVVKNCWLYGDWSGAAVDAITAASTHMTIRDNYIFQYDGAAGLSISAHASTTGLLASNRTFSNRTNVVPVAAAMGIIDQLTTNVINTQGFLLPVIDS